MKVDTSLIYKARESRFNSRLSSANRRVWSYSSVEHMAATLHFIACKHLLDRYRQY